MGFSSGVFVSGDGGGAQRIGKEFGPEFCSTDGAEVEAGWAHPEYLGGRGCLSAQKAAVGYVDILVMLLVMSSLPGSP